jgi:hypothetical protein
MNAKDQAKFFLERLRLLNRSDFASQNKDRGIARETLRLMGDLLIRPLLDELAEEKELHLIEPIVNLYLALAALEQGKINPLLSPAKKRGRPRGTGASHMVRGGAAAAMEILMNGGQPEKLAGQAVARMLNKKRIQLPSGKPIEWTTIRAWRKKIYANDNLSKRRLDADVYAACLIGAELQEVVGIGEDGRCCFKPMEEPKRLAERALESGLRYGRPPPKVWGLEELLK